MIWDGGRGNRHASQILSMTLDPLFFCASLGVSSAIWLYAQEMKKNTKPYYSCFDGDLSLCRGMMGEQKKSKCPQIYPVQSGARPFEACEARK